MQFADCSCELHLIFWFLKMQLQNTFWIAECKCKLQTAQTAQTAYTQMQKCRLQIADRKLHTTDVTKFKTTSCRLQTAGRRLHASICKLQAACFKLQAAIMFTSSEASDELEGSNWSTEGGCAAQWCSTLDSNLRSHWVGGWRRPP